MSWRQFLRNLRPEVEHVPWGERGRSSLTAALAIGATVAASQWLFSFPYLLAAVGASAVLIFALPSSPLSQPWSVFGGYVVSATIGVACARWLPGGPLAAGIAVGAAIGAMMTLRCLHAPAGAVALFAVIGDKPIHDLGFTYVAMPVATDAALLVAFGMILNNLVPNRRYPRPHPELKPPDPKHDEEPPQSGLSHEELAAVLDEYGHPLNISGEELDEILTIVARRRQAKVSRGGTAPVQTQD
jgi:CBS domain-containing membrane protein